MKMRPYLLALLLLHFSISAFSQGLKPNQLIRKSTSLTLAQNGSLFNPGAKVGLEMPLKTVNVSRNRKSGNPKEFTRDLFLTANANWYHHPEFHDNVYVTAGLLKRRTSASGFLTETSAEAGVSRTFLGGTTYRVTDEGQVSIEKLAGHYYALASIGGGLGYDFEKKAQLPFLVYSKLNLIAMLPYNSTVYVRPTLEIGVVIKPSNFLSVNVKSKSRH